MTDDRLAERQRRFEQATIAFQASITRDVEDIQSQVETIQSQAEQQEERNSATGEALRHFITVAYARTAFLNFLLSDLLEVLSDNDILDTEQIETILDNLVNLSEDKEDEFYSIFLETASNFKDMIIL